MSMLVSIERRGEGRCWTIEYMGIVTYGMRVCIGSGVSRCLRLSQVCFFKVVLASLYPVCFGGMYCVTRADLGMLELC